MEKKRKHYRWAGVNASGTLLQEILDVSSKQWGYIEQFCVGESHFQSFKWRDKATIR